MPETWRSAFFRRAHINSTDSIIYDSDYLCETEQRSTCREISDFRNSANSIIVVAVSQPGPDNTKVSPRRRD